MADREKTAAGAAQSAGADAGQEGRASERKGSVSALRGSWFDERNREIVVYYLIAVCFLELIVGAVAFFYGVTNAEPLVAGGPKMARFPWVGWLVAALLSPVGLLLLLHLSGQFFSRALNGTEAGIPGEPGQAEEVPKRVRRLYAIVRHAPAVVILLGLIGLGCAILFVDSAMEMAMAVGAALRPHLPVIIIGTVSFLLLGYLGRLWFLARHRRMEQEYAYRMRVLETTGIVLMNKDCVPMRWDKGKLQLLARTSEEGLKALPAGTEEAETADVEDATIVENR